MNPREFTQGSSNWTSYRLGRATGSRVDDALSVLKGGGPSAARRKYAVELLCERLLGYPMEHFVTPAMVWGTETEKLAVTAYELRTGYDVQKVGICQHPTMTQFCASPDRLVGADGLLEVKCPNTATHIAWMLEGVLPKEHAAQCHAELACAPERGWLDFMSFDPRLPQRYQEFVVRVPRNEEAQFQIENGVRIFLTEVEEMTRGIDERNPPILDGYAEPQWDDAAKLAHDDIDAFFDALPAYEEFAQ